VARHQQQKHASQAKRSAPASPEPSVPSGTDVVASLQQLAELKAAGALSDKEFAAAKAKLLAS